MSESVLKESMDTLAWMASVGAIRGFEFTGYVLELTFPNNEVVTINSFKGVDGKLQIKLNTK